MISYFVLGICLLASLAYLIGSLPSFHVAAYTASLGSVTNNDTAALSDDILIIQNGHFLPQQNTLLLGAAAIGSTLSRARLNSPSFRQVTPSMIRPIIAAAAPPANPNLNNLYPPGFRLRGLEELVAELTTNAAGPAQSFVILFLADRIEPVPVGDEYVLRFTSTTAAVANTWTTITATFDTQLPAGVYAVVGGELQSTNQIAWRMIFDDQYYRPGMLGITALGNRSAPAAYDGSWGIWGRFRTTNLPRIQVLANTADAAHEGYLQLVRMG